MPKAALTMLALCLSYTVASARSDNIEPGSPQKIAALNALAGEYLQCSAYFTVVRYCMVGFPAPAIPKLLRDYQQSAKSALNLAVSTSRVAGLNTASVEATSKLISATQMQSISSDCSNIGDLSERYGRFCNQLLRSSDERFAELLAGKICTVIFKCALSSDSILFVNSSRSRQ
jgi:hypothetical protein